MDKKAEQANINAFFALVRAGLWADVNANLDLNDNHNVKVDWDEVYRLAEEQSVFGVVLAGIERLKNLGANIDVPQEILLQWIGEVQILEKQNIDMNGFIATLVDKMREVGIYTLLVKGQGIAQCYEKPLWRNCGDVDFFLSETNYESAKKHLSPLANSVEPEGAYKKHLGLTIDSWVVELHGTMRCGLSSKMDKGIDEIQNAVFCGGEVRSWINGNTQVFIPKADCDVLFVFTHFLKHFYTGGLGLRQICDWCRLLWTYRDKIDVALLNMRLQKMGLVSEWKAFGAFAVDTLGMPNEVMPLYTADVKWKKKASHICDFILEVGNMGHNRDRSHLEKPYLIRKIYSLVRRCSDMIRHSRIFPMDSLRFFPGIVIQGVKSAAKGE